MASSTAKYAINYAQLADTVASLAQTTQDLAGRVDLLLGESGSYNIASIAAVTTHTQNLVFARTYPGNIGASPPGVLLLNLPGTLTAANYYTYWLTSWTGTALTVTGVSVATSWTVAQTNRVVNWRFIPVL